MNADQGSGAPEISAIEAWRDSRRGDAVLLDVRDDHERDTGMARGALALPLAQIEHGIAAIAADNKRRIITVCASGKRSQQARDRLAALGYAAVQSMTGGMQAWRSAELPIEGALLDDDALDRYSRHLLLPEVGVAGQRALSEARVALIGAGGLGAPIALYLAAAGVGHISLIDDDVVERSNLQRQVIHQDAGIGQRKVDSAKAMLEALNPRIDVQVHATRVVAANVEALLGGHDLVIDGADNFATRYLLNAACRQLRIPLVYGAVHRFTGQVSVFDPNRADSPCYRCLFPEPPSAAEAPNCSEAGVLGVLPGTIGLLQATEALKLLLGRGTPLVGRLLCYDALAASFRELRLPRDPACPGCGPDAGSGRYEDIARLCASA